MSCNAWNRKSYGSKHPLFSGEAGIWNGILIRKMDRLAIQFNASENLKVQDAAGTDNTVAVGQKCQRAILLGGQALANVYGKSQGSDYYMNWMERPYNFERNLEVAADCMGGKTKLQFNYANSSGTTTKTDHGVIVLDTYANF